MKISEELEQLLKNLHLKRILEIYDEQAQVAQKEDVPYAEFLTRLLRAQWHARQESALEWRIRRPTCLSAGLWRLFLSPANRGSTANRFAPWPNWSSSPRRKISSSSVKPPTAKPAWPVVYC